MDARRQRMREVMQAADKASKERHAERMKTLWGLVKSIHADLVVGRWVTVETFSLCPLVVPLDKAYHTKRRIALVHVLMSVQDRTRGQSKILPPSGYVCWEWPSKRVLLMAAVGDLIKLPEAVLGSPHIANQAFVDSLEQAMTQGAAMPQPPDPLPELYSAVMARFDF